MFLLVNRYLIFFKPTNFIKFLNVIYLSFYWLEDFLYSILKLKLCFLDAMDTLYIMGLDNEFERGREWINSQLDMNKMVRNAEFYSLEVCVGGGGVSDNE